jgi:hypothetical protein
MIPSRITKVFLIDRRLTYDPGTRSTYGQGTSKHFSISEWQLILSMIWSLIKGRMQLTSPNQLELRQNVFVISELT